MAVGETGGAVVLTEARIGQRWRDQPDVTELRIPRPEELSSAVLVRVGDVDRHHARALEGGARILHTPEDYPYGERQYSAMDPCRAPLVFSTFPPRSGGGEPLPSAPEDAPSARGQAAPGELYAALTNPRAFR